MIILAIVLKIVVMYNTTTGYMTKKTLSYYGVQTIMPLQTIIYTLTGCICNTTVNRANIHILSKYYSYKLLHVIQSFLKASLTHPYLPPIELVPSFFYAGLL